MSSSPPREPAAWRKCRRQALLSQRTSLPKETLSQWQLAMDTHFERWFPQFASHGAVVAVYWPHRGEYDARALAARWRAAGMTIVLPVVMAPATPLIFREWQPDTVMEAGPQGILHPAHGPLLIPSVLVIPALGFDRQGYRLGYGGGYYDRTLAALGAGGRLPADGTGTARQVSPPIAIATGYEMGRLDSLFPQSHDVPMDYVLTEAGVFRRSEGRLLPADAG